MMMLAWIGDTSSPKGDLVAKPANSTKSTDYVGGGVRYYLTRPSFSARRIQEPYVFTKRNQNGGQVGRMETGLAFCSDGAVGGAARLRFGRKCYHQRAERAPPSRAHRARRRR